MKQFTGKYNKTAIAMLFSLFGATASLSSFAAITDTLHQERVVQIVKHGDAENVKVLVDVNGKTTNVELPVAALSDSVQLETLLADVPEDVRENLIENLSNLEANGKVIKVIANDDEHELRWLSEDGDNVVVMEFNDENTGTIEQKVRHLAHANGNRVIKFKHGATGASTDLLVNMLKHGKFSAEDLDKIQQALDAKR